MERLTNLEVRVDVISPSPFQPRLGMDEGKLNDLANSIMEHGLIYPVLVRMSDGKKYELISGERRWRAARMAGLDKIPATVVGGTDEELHELALLDNIQRENLTPLEEARAFHGLMMAHNYKIKDVAKKLGKSNGYIVDRLKLLELSQEAAQMATKREIPQRTLRDVAALPEKAQAGALEYLQDTKTWEGQPTTRQATNYLKALTRFLDPEHWTVPLDVVVKPETRNYLRLIQQLLSESDLEEVSPRLAGLRHADAWGTNVLNKTPVDMDRATIAYVLDAITGQDQRADGCWQEYAPPLGWRCESCICGGLPAEEREELRFYCPLAYEPEGYETCPRFIGSGDPVVIPLDRWSDLEYFQKVVIPPEEIYEADGVGSYIADLDLYVRLYKAACREKARMTQEQAQASRRKHVGPLQEYASHLLEDKRLSAGHGMAHDCRRCAHHVAGEGPHDLCGYLQEPLKARHGDETRAPEFGILVREDGMMVPRCELFRYATQTLPELPRLAGFRLPDHKVVVGWIDSICRAAASQDHYYTLCGVLAWLPYSRAQDKGWERTKLLSHLRKEWDSYGDEAVAWLVQAALLESWARSAWGGAMLLPNPVSGVEEKWAALRWLDFVRGRKPYSWPEGWPTPWVGQEE